MESRADVVVVGGGIVGLATGYRLLEARPDLRVTVLEREPDVGRWQSSRNSGVLHAGLYYTPGSAKARWCTTGKRQLERFCDDHGVPVERNGKVVAAVDPGELPGLQALAGRARQNGVEIHELPDRAAVHEHEPHLDAIAGLWSPTTAVVDFATVCDVLAARITDLGGQLHTGTEVIDLDDRDREVRVTTDRGPIEAAQVVTCAGLQADRLAATTTTDLGPLRIVPFRGSWLRLRPERAHLVHGNVYPVPVGGGLPFLGVHLTRRIDGQVWIGPNAVLALAREGPTPWSASWRDLRDTLSFPGLYRLAVRHAGTAIGELWRDRIVRATMREVRRYLPDLTVDDVERGPWGVRAQLMHRDGRLVEDFTLRRTGRILHVLNAPSPAATASLAIGAALRDQLLGEAG